MGNRARHLSSVAFSVYNSSRRGYPGDEGAHIAISELLGLLNVIGCDCCVVFDGGRDHSALSGALWGRN